MDFVAWIPQGIYVELILPQNDFLSLKVEIIEDFYKQDILPELIGKWYTKMPIITPVGSNVAPESSEPSVEASGT